MAKTFKEESPTRPFNEPPTGIRGKDFATYQALLSVFDELTDEERLDFIELAFLFKGIPSDRRKGLLAELSKETLSPV